MTARALAWALSAVTAALAIATAAFALGADGTPLPPDEGDEVVSFAGELAFSLMMLAFGALGALLAARRPRNPIGWLLCVASLSLGISGAVTGWYVRAYYAAPGSPAPPDALLWFAGWIWVPGFIPLITALLLLFPDGRLPSRRWWPAGALVGLVARDADARLRVRAGVDGRLPAGPEPARPERLGGRAGGLPARGRSHAADRRGASRRRPRSYRASAARAASSASS